MINMPLNIPATLIKQKRPDNPGAFEFFLLEPDAQTKLPNLVSVIGYG